MRLILLICIVLLSSDLLSQLQKGFDKQEYLEVLRMTSRQGDSTFYKNVEAPEQWSMIYRSAPKGLDNRWDLWKHKEQPLVSINLRGTTSQSISWLENFYSGMIPAAGEIAIAPDKKVQYHFSSHPQAYVHAGWTTGVAYLLEDVLSKIDSCYQSGTKDFLICGHSQGGALTLLLTAQLWYMKERGELPKDIRLKSYASAAPKPGNLFFAYSYEAMTQHGWSYTVVNAHDWVPETPVSIQTIDDYNKVNPFRDADVMFASQGLLTRVFLKKAYNDLDKPARKAQREYIKYLGEKTSGFVKKNLPHHANPDFVKSFHYVRCGAPIVLLGDESYFTEFPDDPKKVFVHHMMEPYIFLTQKLP